MVVDASGLSPAGAELWLSPAERRLAELKKAPEAHRAWLLGRLAAKAAAAAQWGVEPAEAQILNEPDGRPRLFAPGGRMGEISISHSCGAAAALAGPEPVGVDLERAGRRLSDRVWRWAFTAPQRALSAGAHPTWPARLALWCAREAAGKAAGLGLLNHLRQIRAEAADWRGGKILVRLDGRPARGLWVRLIRRQAYLIAFTALNQDFRA